MSVPGQSPNPTGHGIAGRGQLLDGCRIGRFVLLRDIDGRLHAVAATAVAAACQTDDGDTLLMLPGARMVRVGQRLETVLGWLDGKGPG